jgi:hypothetical protein
VPQITKLRFVLLVLELFVLNCLIDFLIEEDSENPTNHSSHSSLAKHSDGFALWKSLKSNLFFTLTDGRGQVISRLRISCWKKY